MLYSETFLGENGSAISLIKEEGFEGERVDQPTPRKIGRFRSRSPSSSNNGFRKFKLKGGWGQVLHDSIYGSNQTFHHLEFNLTIRR